MALISIVGTSGVGKSFLVKQLAALTQSPAFFEGEEGTIPAEIWDSIFDGSHPLKRWRWFMNRYKNNLERAAAICHNTKLDCFVDGAILSAQAILTYESDEHKAELTTLLKEYEYLHSDLIVLLTASKERLLEQIQSRSRDSEANAKAIDRALKIQEAFQILARQEKNVLLIDRSNLDFSNYDDVNNLWLQIKEKLNILKTK
ncbi:MAG: AAA family ATPase [Candidatus Komeilibacteria bacterium]